VGEWGSGGAGGAGGAGEAGEEIFLLSCFLPFNATCVTVGRADGRCFKPGNPSNALPPQRSGSPFPFPPPQIAPCPMPHAQCPMPNQLLLDVTKLAKLNSLTRFQL
jgi:hypothetical protein